jgi:ABC-2 type transport system ATP-binding protein
MKYAVELKNIHKTYDSGTIALKDISLAIEQGDFFALLGPNGAGKSTTIGILSQLVRKTSGEVKVFDMKIEEHSLDVKASIGLVPQEFNFNIFEKVEDIVYNQAGYYGLTKKEAQPQVDKLLIALGLENKRKSKSMELSGGMKRRLMIARALVHQPKLLILDEPTAGVDVELRLEMWDFLKELNQNGTTIIMTTHYLEEAEKLCKNIAIINKGEIAKSGTMKEVLNGRTIEEVYLEVTKK